MTRRRMALALAALLVSTTGTLAGPASAAFAGSSPGVTVTLPDGQKLPCPNETFPDAGAPLDSPPTPYGIPFSATLGQTTPQGIREGGYLTIANGTVTVTLGGPLATDPTTAEQYGSIFADMCGVLQLPSQTGTIGATPGTAGDPNYNPDFVFYPNPINVTLGITGIPGLPLMSAYAAVDGTMTTSIDRAPAANGGLDLEFYGNAKSTSDFGPALASLVSALPATALPQPIQSLLGSLPVVKLPGGSSTVVGAACTIYIGNSVVGGVPAADIPETGLTPAEATAPVHFSTISSGDLTGLPVTGPVTGADATLVANDFSVGKILPNPDPSGNTVTPAPGYQQSTGQEPTCSQANADLLNQLLNLPSVPHGNVYPNSFYAPSTFAIFTSS